LDERIGIIGAVSNQVGKVQLDDQGLGLGDIVTLPSRQDEPQWITQPINPNVDLGAEATPTAS
jgi:hypothetical protein